MQCVESEIFIDNIFYPLREKGIPCFTRHDSIVVARGYEKLAEKHAKEVFDKLGFKYNHVVDDKFWDVVEIDEDDDFFQWLMDENQIFDAMHYPITYDEKNTNSVSMDDLDRSKPQTLSEILIGRKHLLVTCDRLIEIGIQDDYQEMVDADFLEEISELPILNQGQKNILYNCIIDMRGEFIRVDDEVNDLLRRLVGQLTQLNDN